MWPSCSFGGAIYHATTPRMVSFYAERRAGDGRRLLVELVLRHLLAEGVAVDPEVLGGAGKVAAVLLQHPGDEPLLELTLGLGEPDPLVDHLDDERFQLLLHVRELPWAAGPLGPGERPTTLAGLPTEAVVRLYVLLHRARDDFRRELGARRLLVPVEGLEVVAHELLVEAGL